MTKHLDGTGADGEWRVRQNCVWRSEATAELDCEPVDLTDATITAVVTPSSDDTTVLKTFVTTITDPLAGQFAIQIDEADADLAVGKYWWAMEWNLGDGNEPLVSGPFIVQPWAIVS